MSIVTHKIDGMPPGTNPIGKAPNATTSAGNDKPVQPVDAPNPVSVSGEARQMQAMHEQASKVPEVNQARVDAIKAAIANGQFQIDSQAVAKGLLGIEQGLNS